MVMAHSNIACPMVPNASAVKVHLTTCATKANRERVVTGLKEVAIDINMLELQTLPAAYLSEIPWNSYLGLSR